MINCILGHDSEAQGGEAYLVIPLLWQSPEGIEDIIQQEAGNVCVYVCL
jgi:hypothetical protein